MPKQHALGSLPVFNVQPAVLCFSSALSRFAFPHLHPTIKPTNQHHANEYRNDADLSFPLEEPVQEKGSFKLESRQGNPKIEVSPHLRSVSASPRDCRSVSICWHSNTFEASGSLATDTDTASDSITLISGILYAESSQSPSSSSF